MRIGPAVVIGRTAAFGRSALVDELLRTLRDAYGPAAVHQEYPFAGITERRRWRFDVAILPVRIAIEIQGFAPSGGHGRRGAGSRMTAGNTRRPRRSDGACSQCPMRCCGRASSWSSCGARCRLGPGLRVHQLRDDPRMFVEVVPIGRCRRGRDGDAQLVSQFASMRLAPKESIERRGSNSIPVL